MLKGLYSVRDIKGGHFYPPFLAHSDGEALRNFSALHGDPQTTIHNYPDDFCLFKLATIDILSGKVEALESPYNFGSASQFVHVMEEVNDVGN